MMSTPQRSFAQPQTSVRYLIGIDGGGSGTRARLASATGSTLGFGEAGPSGLGQGIEQAWRHIGQAVDAAFRNAGLPPAAPTVCALGLGLAGAHVHERCEALLATAPPYRHIALDTDAYTTLLGAHGGQPGCVVAAGTGSVGEALHRDGRRVSVGGWGFSVGDEGGGAWLGLRAMRQAHRAVDGRAEAGPLVHAIWQLAGSTREALLAWCEHAGQHAYAQLAPLVFDTEAVDADAAELVKATVHSLEAIATALDPRGDLPLVVCGSIGLRLAPRFSPQLRARQVAQAGDSADGALQLIRLALGDKAAS